MNKRCASKEAKRVSAEAYDLALRAYAERRYRERADETFQQWEEERLKRFLARQERFDEIF